VDSLNQSDRILAVLNSTHRFRMESSWIPVQFNTKRCSRAWGGSNQRAVEAFGKPEEHAPDLRRTAQSARHRLSLPREWKTSPRGADDQRLRGRGIAVSPRRLKTAPLVSTRNAVSPALRLTEATSRALAPAGSAFAEASADKSGPRGLSAPLSAKRSCGRAGDRGLPAGIL